MEYQNLFQNARPRKNLCVLTEKLTSNDKVIKRRNVTLWDIYQNWGGGLSKLPNVDHY